MYIARVDDGASHLQRSSTDGARSPLCRCLAETCKGRRSQHIEPSRQNTIYRNGVREGAGMTSDAARMSGSVGRPLCMPELRQAMNEYGGLTGSTRESASESKPEVCRRWLQQWFGVLI